MPASAHTEPHLEILQADNVAQYLLREPREIAFVLRQLGARRAMITAYFGPEHEFITTSVIDLTADNKTLLLDLSKDEAAINEAIRQGRLLCATQIDKVKVQFPLERIERTLHEGFPALRAALPDLLLRLQRREYYRLSSPALDSVICQITLSGSRKFNARVLDISGGGLAIIAPPDGQDLAVGSVFENCTLTLPDGSPIKISLEVRNLFRMTTRGGQDVLRAGCQLLQLRSAEANLIQRFILKTERERNHYRV